MIPQLCPLCDDPPVVRHIGGMTRISCQLCRETSVEVLFDHNIPGVNRAELACSIWNKIPLVDHAKGAGK
jgi:hypothetical protein